MKKIEFLSVEGVTLDSYEKGGRITPGGAIKDIFVMPDGTAVIYFREGKLERRVKGLPFIYTSDEE